MDIGKNCISQQYSNREVVNTLNKLNSNLTDPVYGIALAKSILYYLFETSDFLYYNRYLKRDHTLKMTSEIVAYEYNLVRQDYTLTSFTGFKTFFLRNTQLLSYYRNRLNFFPLTSTGITRKRYLEIFFRYANFLQHSGDNIRYINYKVNINSDKHQCIFPNYIKLIRPLNRLTLIGLAMKHTVLSFNTPFYIFRRRHNKKEYFVLYLGVKYTIFDHYKSVLNSFFKKYIIKQNLRYYRRKVFFRLKSRAYLFKRNDLIFKSIGNFYIRPRGLIFDRTRKVGKKVIKRYKKNTILFDLPKITSKLRFVLRSRKYFVSLRNVIYYTSDHDKGLERPLYFCQSKRLIKKRTQFVIRRDCPQRKKYNMFFRYRVPIVKRFGYFVSFKVLLRYLIKKRKSIGLSKKRKLNIRGLSLKRFRFSRRLSFVKKRGGSQPVNRKGIISTGRPTKRYDQSNILYTKRQMKYRRY